MSISSLNFDLSFNIVKEHYFVLILSDIFSIIFNFVFNLNIIWIINDKCWCGHFYYTLSSI